MGLTRQMWQGAIANNSAGSGYMEFPGLDSQITTGHVDASTGTTCPAVDSDVKDFNYSDISGVDADDIVWYLSTLEDYLHHNAIRMGLDPVEWAVVMRPELWNELTQVYPIAYNTNRGANIIAAGNNVRLSLDAGDMTAMRDAMRAQMQIAINGRNYPVVTDDGIFEHTNINNANVPLGSYASSIYMVPLTINGGFPVTYMEYKDYRVGMAQLQAMMGKQTFWTDGGMFSWALDPIRKWCFKMSAKTERRVICRAPQLAGKIENILYAPLQHLRDSFPGSPYEADGGVSTRAATSLNAVWS
jgi:hypothetical protein